MSRKKKHNPPVPKDNQPQFGNARANGPDVRKADEHSDFQNQDPKRRLGGYTTQGEHAIVQPSQLNDGTQRSQ